MKNSEWGKYEDIQRQQQGDWYIWTAKFTFDDGRVIYRWSKSKMPMSGVEMLSWQDKNRKQRGRTPAQKHFLSRDDALKAAKLSIRQ